MDKLFFEKKFRIECYKLNLYFYDAERGTLTNVTNEIIAYIKALKNKYNKYGLWVRCNYLYGGKYGEYYNSLKNYLMVQ